VEVHTGPFARLLRGIGGSVAAGGTGHVGGPFASSDYALFFVFAQLGRDRVAILANDESIGTIDGGISCNVNCIDVCKSAREDTTSPPIDPFPQN
jgi:hypothetical protein